jgi:hypothetical protein
LLDVAGTLCPLLFFYKNIITNSSQSRFLSTKIKYDEFNWCNQGKSQPLLFQRNDSHFMPVESILMTRTEAQLRFIETTDLRLLLYIGWVWAWFLLQKIKDTIVQSVERKKYDRST